MNKIALGTAQLGMNYGISNKRGKIPPKEVFEILTKAIDFEIDVLDTAYVYGTSEDAIGKFLLENKANIKIITKLPSIGDEYSKEKIYNFFRTSLNRLKQKNIFCYMVHDVADILNDKANFISKTFEDLKKEKLIEKIGVSVYDKKEIDFVLRNFEFDIIQLPFSIFDQRLLQDSTIKMLKEKGKEIYARSIFLQGVIFLEKENIPNQIKDIAVHIKKLEQLGHKIKLSKEEIALLFVYSNSYIDRVVIGIDNIMQLERNMDILKKLEYFKSITKTTDFEEIRINNPILVNPGKWKE
ncbi:MAG: aldo/keto reductase [bacterium]|nr:aldo/keto reductase [bacterium]